MIFTLGGHAQCVVSQPKIYATNENTSQIMSSVYPVQCTLFYIVKNYCQEMILK